MATKKYDDQLLESLHTVYRTNPQDLDFKKYFALELYKKGELKDARSLLAEVFEIDKDLNVEHALNDIALKLEPEAHKMGFVTGGEPEIEVPKPKKNGITFANVAGMDTVKEAIRTDIIYPFQHPEMYAKYNKQAGGGILMFGPPGCGKTYIARASAGEINAEFVSASIHELLSSYAGEGERSLHYFFETARRNAPAVMFFDEIDAIGGSRSGLNSVVRPLVNQLLTEMDGLEDDNKDLLIIGATNLPWEVDSALRRPGRFDKILFVPPPDNAARARLFELHMSGKPHDDIDYAKLADITKQYSAADIVRICDEASEETFKLAIRSGQEENISQQLLVQTAKHSHSSITEWFNTVRNYIEYSNQSGLFDQVKDYLQKSKMSADFEQLQRLTTELQALDGSHRYDLIASVATRLLAIDPYNRNALYSLATAQYQQARLSQSDDDFTTMRQTTERALAAYPNDGYLYFMLFHYYLWYGGSQYIQARDCLLRAIELEPRQAEYFRWLGEIYLINREADKAARYLQEAVRLAPTVASYRSRYALALLRQHRVADSKTTAQQALHDGPDDKGVLDDVGMIYILLGDLTKADRFFRDAISRDPTYNYFHKHIDWIKRELHDKQRREQQSKKYTPLYIRQKGSKRFFDEDGPVTVAIDQLQV